MSDKLDEVAKFIALQENATPGPWTVELRKCGIGCCDDIAHIYAQYQGDLRPDRHLACVDGGNAVWLREGETQANARLIIEARNSPIGRIARDAIARLEKAIELIEDLRAHVGDYLDPEYRDLLDADILALSKPLGDK